MTSNITLFSISTVYDIKYNLCIRGCFITPIDPFKILFLLQPVFFLKFNFFIFSQRDRKESQALDLVLHASSSQMIATIMLLEMFPCTCSLILSLQKSLESLCMSEVNTHVEITLQNLENILLNGIILVKKSSII